MVMWNLFCIFVYYQIQSTMALKRELKEVNKELQKWVTMVPVNWIGKWGRSVRINQLTKKRDSILTQIEINKIKYEKRHK